MSAVQLQAATPQAAAAEPEVLMRVVNRVAVITLNRPSALNALSHGMVRQLATLLEQCRHDDGIAALVLRGAGQKGFCAGGDVRALYQLAQQGHIVLQHQHCLGPAECHLGMLLGDRAELSTTFTQRLQGLLQAHLHFNQRSAIARNRREDILEQVFQPQSRNPHLRAASLFALLRLRSTWPTGENTHGAANHINGRARIVHRRRQRPGGDLGQHRQAETRVLIE